MSGAGSGFDFNAVTYSPDGRLFQVEYATKAVEKEDLAIGVRCSDGILFACEKNTGSKLLMPGANPRIYWIDNRIACAPIGYKPDCFAVVEKARKEAQSYFANFGCQISVPELVSRISSSFHQCHAASGWRPYGCSVMFASQVDHSLYALEPSGQYFGYFACCFGKNASLARAELQNTEWETKTVLEAVPIVGDIIKTLHVKQNKAWEIEMVWVCEASGNKPEKVPESVFPFAQGE